MSENVSKVPELRVKPGTVQAAWQAMLADRAIEGLYAVVDAAVDCPGLHHALRQSQLPYELLLDGEIEQPLREAAPCCVHLGANPVAGFELFEKIWARNAAMFISGGVGATLWSIRKQLRKNLRVALPSGKRVMFRYYDPRVLRAFLPTCSESQISHLMGDGEFLDIFCESEDGDALIRWRTQYTRGMGAVRRSDLECSPCAALPSR